MKKLLSIFLALAMAIGVLVPSLSKASAEAHKTTVVIHKIVMPDAAFEAHQTDKSGYNGTKLADIKSFFHAEAKDVAGVKFIVYQVSDSQVGGFTKGDDSSLPVELKADPSKYYKKIKESDETKENLGVDITLEDGTYRIIEDREHSSYFNNDKVLTKMKAVPIDLELPMTMPDGKKTFDTKDKLHVYPKNTEEAPKIDKKIENDKTSDDVNIGDKIPYVVNTTIPKGSTYKTLRWSDLMVKGLEYNMDVQISDDSNISLQQNDYLKTETKRGFMITLTAEGLKKVEKAAENKDVKITLKYTATVTKEAKVDEAIPNKIRFDYGNRPNTFTEPSPVKPSGKKIVITKNWAEGILENEKVTAKFDIYEKGTGKFIKTVELNKQNRWSETVNDLDDEKEYLIVEQSISGYTPEYLKKNPDGTFTVTNKKNPNPNPNEPEPPTVITHGAKFVKVDNSSSDTKLAGAEFIITNEDKNKYLSLKDFDTKKKDQEDYLKAQREYLKAVKDKAGDIDDKKRTRDEAFEKLSLQWTWVNEPEKAFVFVSDNEGKFEVKGLKKGTYHLKEIKAPDGYALPSDPFVLEFKADNGTYGVDATKQVKNKKVTIPQTGGIGTIIFTALGIVIMAGSVYAMKRRRAEEV